MKRFVVICFVLTLFNISTTNFAFAEITDKEVSQYINDIGLTNEEVENYLTSNHSSIDEFDSVADLDSFLGTPITSENLNQLLTVHDLSEEELHTLLSGFGENLDNYLFIEDLEVDVGFYLKHAEIIHEAERLLSDIGMTRDEANQLFDHIITLNNNGSLERELSPISINLEQYYSYDSNTQLSDAQKADLRTQFENMLSILQLNPSYYVMNNGEQQPVNLDQLLSTDITEDQVIIVQLNNEDDQVVMDLQLTKDKLSADFLILRGEQFINMASLANELNVSMMAAELPNTASPFWNNILIGLALSLLGWFILVRNRPAKS
ncbi:processed acidic surface protein [Bacillus sp. PS06]|uniref:processed acidic surface protein n=1 Tax=Bacillus sp. PS06 TaxID=2764176 RepID=UPI0017807F54|nr:processed acidic surface protein [Bacillus sp. PS06]MBD8070536.1 processed acidic surface protein [Bacillus sp. PS06]